ncbi:Uncharacterised protein, partial [Mycoplasmopsis synoviae]
MLSRNELKLLVVFKIASVRAFDLLIPHLVNTLQRASFNAPW